MDRTPEEQIVILQADRALLLYALQELVAAIPSGIRTRKLMDAYLFCTEALRTITECNKKGLN